VKDGKLRALAVGGQKRVRELPDIPTMREAGFAEVECDAWQVVLVPSRVPRYIIALLHGEIDRVVRLPDVQARLVALGFEPFAATPDEVAALIKTELRNGQESSARPASSRIEIRCTIRLLGAERHSPSSIANGTVFAPRGLNRELRSLVHQKAAMTLLWSEVPGSFPEGLAPPAGKEAAAPAGPGAGERPGCES
jgi:hypothetical protein